MYPSMRHALKQYAEALAHPITGIPCQELHSGQRIFTGLAHSCSSSILVYCGIIYFKCEVTCYALAQALMLHIGSPTTWKEFKCPSKHRMLARGWWTWASSLRYRVTDTLCQQCYRRPLTIYFTEHFTAGGKKFIISDSAYYQFLDISFSSTSTPPMMISRLVKNISSSSGKAPLK